LRLRTIGCSPVHRVWLLPVLLALCFGGGIVRAPSTAAQAPVSGEFVARLGASDSFAGIVVGQGKAIAFVCNGTDAGVSVWGWFAGDVTEGHTRLTSTTGLTLDLHFTNSDISGVVTYAGGTYETFQASPLPADSVAGLYRAEGTVADGTFVGGWIILEDLDFRGHLFVAPSGGGGVQPHGTGGYSAGNRTASIMDGSSNTFVTPTRVTSDIIAILIG
jgi:hypothetical protein